MATFHRKEVLNWHMNDSNWKKIKSIPHCVFLAKEVQEHQAHTDRHQMNQAMEASIDPTLLVTEG
ncbi:hypothetical protein AcW1_009288 [Taiwanofungus camphoratus]|nr:hypothetical protein AcW1_009288 [Antrodia cinnamomea]